MTFALRWCIFDRVILTNSLVLPLGLDSFGVLLRHRICGYGGVRFGYERRLGRFLG